MGDISTVPNNTDELNPKSMITDYE